MDPQFVFLVWLPIFVVGCFVTGYRDDAARKSWRPDFFLSGITILRWTFSANYAQLHMPTVEALNRRFASNWGWTTTFRQIAPNHIAFQGGEKGRNPRNALVHGRIEFNATTSQVIVVGYPNQTTVWFYSGLAALALLTMNAAAWAMFLFLVLLGSFDYWRQRDHYEDIGRFASLALRAPESQFQERA